MFSVVETAVTQKYVRLLSPELSIYPSFCVFTRFPTEQNEEPLDQ